ncbi:MAG: helix-turn-helix domain-containing protein [Treponema sp.]|nr:helix-turn-helix domain-containing protein [Treponema sp.]
MTIPLTESPNLLTRREAANYLGKICLTTLNRLTIPKIRIRRRTMYRIEDLQQWVSQQIVEPGTKK